MSRVRVARGVVGWVKLVTVQGPPLALGTRRVQKLFTYQTLKPAEVFQQPRRDRVVTAPGSDPVAALLGTRGG